MDDFYLDWRPDDQHLPSTQHIVCDCTTPGCSKALWGLRLQVEVTGLCASKVNFAGRIVETVGLSLGHSCKSPIKRQGITLP
jgi:hypothetical protein